MPGLLFRHPGFGIGGIAEDEDIKAGGLPRFTQRVQHGPDAGHEALHVFIVDGEEDGCAYFRIGQRQRFRAGQGDRETVMAAERDPHTGHGSPEAHGNPREQHAEQTDHEQFEILVALVGKHQIHGARGQQRGQDDQRKQAEAPPQSGSSPAQLVSHEIFLPVRNAPAADAGARRFPDRQDGRRTDVRER